MKLSKKMKIIIVISIIGLILLYLIYRKNKREKKEFFQSSRQLCITEDKGEAIKQFRKDNNSIKSVDNIVITSKIPEPSNFKN